MRREDAWGSVLELALLARRFKMNLVPFTDGREAPEFIPGWRYQTEVLGYQNRHFFWYDFKWETTFTGSEDSIATANFDWNRRGGGLGESGHDRTGPQDGCCPPRSRPNKRARVVEPDDRRESLSDDSTRRASDHGPRRERKGRRS